MYAPCQFESVVVSSSADLKTAVRANEMNHSRQLRSIMLIGLYAETNRVFDSSSDERVRMY